MFHFVSVFLVLHGRIMQYLNIINLSVDYLFIIKIELDFAKHFNCTAGILV